jgi:hypothetical protein
MPNVLCERCDQRACRVRCSECTKPVCEGCRQTVHRQYVCTVCNFRRMPTIVQSNIQVKRDRVELSPWRVDVDRWLEQMYVAAGSPVGIRPMTARLSEYITVDRSNGTHVRDRYARIGKHYTCHRDFIERTAAGAIAMIRVTFPLHLSEDQKESIAAAAMHPSRLQRWLDRGWEDDWDDYFS